jgi:hypothetical protein
MKKRKTFVIIGIIALLVTTLVVLAISLNGKQDLFGRHASTPSNFLTDGTDLEPTATFMIVCTPPRCSIGTSEVYFCPGTCPAGCGTTCATYTPNP